MDLSQLTGEQQKILENWARDRKRVDRLVEATRAAETSGSMTRQRVRAMIRRERKAIRSNMKKRALQGKTRGGAAVIRSLPA